MNNQQKNIMNRYSVKIFLVTFCLLFGFSTHTLAQDEPPREYTNPDEVVTFDRSTDFQRAIDVINEFSQENRNKVIIDRTDTEGALDVSVPPMHWEDALDLIMRAKDLYVVEDEEYFEIVETPPGEEEEEDNEDPTAGEDGEDELDIDTETKEIRINAIFFEGNRSALRELGVDWSTLTENVPENVDDYVDSESNESLPDGGGFENGGPFVQVNSRGAQNVSQNVFNSLVNMGELGNSGIQVQALFSAFEADNLGEIIASPSVKVRDGEEGNIQVGEDFSIKQRDFSGNVTDEFFSVGTILTVTPDIVEYEDTTIIHLDVEAERSSAQPDPVSTIINKQEASTQSLLIDGETTVVAGLYRTEENEVRRGVPILKDLPPWAFGLRYLFGFSSDDYSMRELVIVVQASIEPSIKERFARRDNMDDKFQVLENERNRVRDEILRRDQGSAELVDEPFDEGGDEIDMEEEAEKDSLKMQEEEQPEEDTTRKEQDDRSDEQESQEENPDSTTIDPEIDPEDVALNFTEADSSEKQKQEETEQEDQPQDQEIEETEPPSKGAYYIIAGSFKQENKAINHAEELAEKGYEPEVIEQPDSDFFYVVYNSYDDIEEARSELKKIKADDNDSAWLLRGES